MIVWLASYPRSGNTFFRVILNSIFEIKTYSIYDDTVGIGADEKTSEIVGHEFLPEDFNIEEARDSEKIYYIKTHELLDNRVDKNDKVIYLIRDGRESTLSFTKHQNTFSNQNKQLIDTIYGNTFIGSWGEHVKSWNPKIKENTLLVKFEELIKNPIQYIEILAKFLDIESVGDKIPTFEELKKINPKFFRNGKTNSWEDIYSEEEHISFWLKNYKIMIEYDYDYKKPDILNDIKTNRFILESIHQNNYLMNLIFAEKKKLQGIHNKIGLFNKQLEEKDKQLEEKDKQLENLEKKIKTKNIELENLINSKKYKLAIFLTYPYLLLKQVIK